MLHLDGMTFYGNTPFPFQVHVVQYLVLKVTVGQGMGKLYQTVGKCAFSMINMGYDAKVPDVIHG
jgi:hypothetical protein